MKLTATASRAPTSIAAPPVSRAAGGTVDPCLTVSQDLPLLAQHAILTAQAPESLLPVRRQAVRAAAGVAGRLDDPVPDRDARGFILSRQLLGRLAGPHQLDQPAAQLRAIGGSGPGHRGLLL